jgi:hypothetical protein
MTTTTEAGEQWPPAREFCPRCGGEQTASEFHDEEACAWATIAKQVSEYLTHYIDGQATVTLGPAAVEAVLDRGDLTSLASFGDSARWVARLIRETAANCR